MTTPEAAEPPGRRRPWTTRAAVAVLVAVVVLDLLLFGEAAIFGGLLRTLRAGLAG